MVARKEWNMRTSSQTVTKQQNNIGDFTYRLSQFA